MNILLLQIRNIGFACQTDLFSINGQLLLRIEDDEVGACIGVDQAAAVSLPQRVEAARFIQVAQRGQVFSPVILGRVGLKKNHTFVKENT